MLLDNDHEDDCETCRIEGLILFHKLVVASVKKSKNEEVDHEHLLFHIWMELSEYLSKTYRNTYLEEMLALALINHPDADEPDEPGEPNKPPFDKILN